MSSILDKFTNESIIRLNNSTRGEAIGLLVEHNSILHFLSNSKNWDGYQSSGLSKRNFRYSWMLGSAFYDDYMRLSVIEEVGDSLHGKLLKINQPNTTSFYGTVVKILYYDDILIHTGNDMVHIPLSSIEVFDVCAVPSLIINVGDTLVIDNISSWSSELVNECSMSIPISSVITVTKVGTWQATYLPFAALYNGKEYGFSLELKNAYHKLDTYLGLYPNGFYNEDLSGIDPLIRSESISTSTKKLGIITAKKFNL